MRKIGLIALALLAMPALSGCGLISISTNIPPLNGSGYKLTVINSSDYEIALVVNGEQMEFEFPNGHKSLRLKRGQTALLEFTNWGNRHKEVSLVAMAWSSHGCGYVKSASGVIHVSNEYGESKFCDITNEVMESGNLPIGGWRW